MQNRIKIDAPQTPFEVERVIVVKQQPKNGQKPQQIQPAPVVVQANQKQWQEPDVY